MTGTSPNKSFYQRMPLLWYSKYSIKVEWFGARLSTTLDISFLFYKIKQSNSVSFSLPSGSKILCLMMKFLLPNGLSSPSDYAHLHPRLSCMAHTRIHILVHSPQLCQASCKQFPPTFPTAASLLKTWYQKDFWVRLWEGSETRRHHLHTDLTLRCHLLWVPTVSSSAQAPEVAICQSSSCAHPISTSHSLRP